MAVKRVKRVLPVVTIPPTEEEQASVVQAAEQIKAYNGVRRKYNPNRSPDELVENKVKAGELIPLTLPMPKPLMQNEIITNAPSDLPALAQHYVEPAAGKLTISQLKAITMLANLVDPKTIEQVASELELSPSTLYNWFNQSLFQSVLEERTRGNFYNIGRFKLFNVYNRELNKGTASSRMMEQVAKTLGLFSDSDTVNVQVNIERYGNQSELETDI